MDFDRLNTAIVDIRGDQGSSGANSSDDSQDFFENGEAGLDPLRSRRPNFRWRVLPVIFCAFMAFTMGVGISQMIVAEIYFNRGFWPATSGITLTLLFMITTYTWARGYWVASVILMICIPLVQPIMGF